MADITKLNMTFVDGDTVIYASTLKSFQNKINELVGAVNSGVSPSPTPSSDTRTKADMEYIYYNVSDRTVTEDPTEAKRVRLITHVDAGASINASTTYDYGFYGGVCTLYDTRKHAISQSQTSATIESISADSDGNISGTFSASGWIVLAGIAGSSTAFFTQALADAFYNGADITITDP